MRRVLSMIARHPLAVFFTASVGLGWLVTVGAIQLASSPLLLPLIAVPVSFIPAVVAWLVLRIRGNAGERSAWRRRLTRVRVGWRWYAVALLALPVVHLAGIGLAAIAGGKVSLHPQALALLPLFVLTNFGEEVGWRGYALPNLQDRMSPLAASLVLGVIWGAFHWAALSMNADAPLAYIAISTIQLVAISVLMTFAFNGSGQSVPVVTLMHATYDTVAIGVAPLAETGMPLTAFGLSAAAAWVVVIALVVATGARLRRASATAATSAAAA